MIELKAIGSTIAVASTRTHASKWSGRWLLSVPYQPCETVVLDRRCACNQLHQLQEAKPDPILRSQEHVRLVCFDAGQQSRRVAHPFA